MGWLVHLLEREIFMDSIYELALNSQLINVVTSFAESVYTKDIETPLGSSFLEHDLCPIATKSILFNRLSLPFSVELIESSRRLVSCSHLINKQVFIRVHHSY